MSLHHFANVERLETFEQAVPDDGDKPRRGNDLRKVRESFRHFAARSRAPQQRAHRRNDAGKNFPIIEFGELGKTTPLGNHEAHDVFPPRFVNLTDEQVDDAVKSERLLRLQAVLDAQQVNFNARSLGGIVPVLFERKGREPGEFVGRTPYLQLVHAAGEGDLIGRTADC